MKPDYGALLRKAAEAAANSYVPYTNRVRGAALLSKGGSVFSGSSVEIASYAGSICPEMAALSQAIAHGERDFSAIALAPGGFPCGLCRQALSEFSSDLDVITAGDDGSQTVVKLSDLLPNSFGKAQLSEGHGLSSSAAEV